MRAALERELGKNLASGTGIKASADLAGAPSQCVVSDGRLLSGQMVALVRLATQGGLDELRFVWPGSLLVPGGADAAAFGAILRQNPVPDLSG